MKETKIRHNFEYHEFILWISLPKELREPKTQVELSKKFRVGEDTLSSWKKQRGFWEEVSKKRKDWSKEKTSDVIYALYKRILETGNSAEVKLWFQLMEDWSERLMTVTEKDDNRLSHLTNAELEAFIAKKKAFFNKTD
jgi:hypothetical protein